MMNVIFGYLLLFFIGSVSGWVLELFFRRIFSAKKWINPGFLNGPYLPLYGCGVVVMYAICSIPMPLWAKIVTIVVLMTVIEYITGLVFIKGMGIKLWDYSERWGNLQGIICPLFSLIWGALGVAFLFFVYPPLGVAVEWLSGHLPFLFLLGIFYGIFIIDVCISFNFSFKIKRAAKEFRQAVRYEQLKLKIRIEQIKANRRASFLFAFKGDRPIGEYIRDLLKGSRREKEDFEDDSADTAEKNEPGEKLSVPEQDNGADDGSDDK